ncbi:MAG: NAD-dependent epimerase/dehydratase family protein [Candidatus Thorarchaeota archaeon]
MADILITGGTGFIGAYLVKKLHDLGHTIKLLVRKSSDVSAFQEFKNVEYIYGDIRNFSSFNQNTGNIDIIYHLAAYTKIWAKDNSIYDEINVNGSENVAKLALEKDAKLIYVSSFFAIGPYKIGDVVPDFETYERDIEFFMDYERTKYLSCKKIQAYKEKGLKTVIFYPGFVYGPGDFNFYGKVTIDIIQEALLGVPKTSDSEFSMSYVYDIIEPMVEIINRDDLLGEEFFLGGETVSTKNYFNMIAEIADVKKPRQFPTWIALFYGWLCEFKAKITKKMPYMTRALIRMATYNWAYSSEKAIKILGYKITPFEQGLMKTVNWYQDYLKSNKKFNKKKIK